MHGQSNLVTDIRLYLITGTSLTRGHQGTSVQANFQEASPLDESPFNSTQFESNQSMTPNCCP